MCGIVATQGVESFFVNKALSYLNHRGPDGQSQISLKSSGIVLGHTRLSIVGQSNGTQPIANENQTIFVCVNGEFYGYKEIRFNLQKMGHNFKTDSDSEILVHLYEEYGVDCLEYLNGEFSFVLYDTQKKRWFCARDRMGSKPLQYYFNGKVFAIASEAKALFQIPGIECKFDSESYWFSQHVQYLPLNKTIFKNIFAIKPCHYILLAENSISEHEYYSYKRQVNEKLTFDAVVDNTTQLLRKAVHNRIPEKDVKWVTHLSGGIDSSIVTALAAEKTDVTSYNIEFTDDAFYNEGLFAQVTADSLGVQLVRVPMCFSDILKEIPNATWHAEGLSINGHIGAKYALNRAIKSIGAKVSLSGEGADELFMGYSHLKQDYLSGNSLKNMETQYLKGFQLPDGQSLNLNGLYAAGVESIPTWLQAKSSMGYKLSTFWSVEFNSMHRSQDPYLEMISDITGYSSFLKASSGSWTKYCLSGYILKVLDDGQSMAHSIEGRLPFLDKDLFDYMLQVPDELFFDLKNNVEKQILRQAFKSSKIPAEVLFRTKQSFMSPPLNRFMVSPIFNQLMEEYLFENKLLIELDLFDLSKLKQAIANPLFAQNQSFEPIIMTLLTTGIIIKNIDRINHDII